MRHLHSSIGLAFSISVFFALGAVGIGKELSMYDSSYDDVHRISFTACEDPDIWHECVVFDVGCTPTNQIVTIIDGAALAATFLRSDTPSVTFQIGAATLEIPVHGFDLAHNDMDGGWILEMPLELGSVFQVIHALRSSEMNLIVADQSFDLTPGEHSSELITGLAKACTI